MKDGRGAQCAGAAEIPGFRKMEADAALWLPERPLFGCAGRPMLAAPAMRVGFSSRGNCLMQREPNETVVRGGA